MSAPRTPSPAPPKISELVESTSEEGQGNGDEASEEENNDDGEGAEQSEEDEKYSPEAIKKTMAACYLNMAICHSKKGDWTKCKRKAEE